MKQYYVATVEEAVRGYEFTTTFVYSCYSTKADSTIYSLLENFRGKNSFAYEDDLGSYISDDGINLCIRTNKKIDVQHFIVLKEYLADLTIRNKRNENNNRWKFIHRENAKGFYTA